MSAAPSSGTGVAVRLRGVSHTYGAGEDAVEALRGVDLDVATGSCHALVGPSGSGKSTVLHLLAGLVRASAGQLWIGPHAVHELPERALGALRSDTVGVLLQSPGQTLLPWATAAQNVELVRRARGRRAARTARGTRELLERLGLAQVAGRAVAGLSGGEQQRVALAAALVHRPGLLLADEPTSALDSATRDATVALLDDVRLETGATLLLTTHDPALVAAADVATTLADGRVVQAAGRGGGP